MIHYGSRWGMDSPPDDSYSVDTHPERFGPIHHVAEALIEHLVAVYDVHVDESHDVAADLLHRPQTIVRAVRLTPQDSAAAKLTFVFTDYPGVYLHAGALHDFHYPVCGCDACDSHWQAEAEQLEKHVFAVIGGCYRESMERGRRGWYEHAMTYPDGSESGKSRLADLTTVQRKKAREVLSHQGGQWQPWELRPEA